MDAHPFTDVQSLAIAVMTLSANPVPAQRKQACIQGRSHVGRGGISGGGAKHKEHTTIKGRTVVFSGIPADCSAAAASSAILLRAAF